MKILSNVDLKFLIVNVNFLNYVKGRLIHKDLLFKINKRLMILNLIENVSENLKECFYGDYYKTLIKNFSDNDIENLLKKILDYSERCINVKIGTSSDRFLYNIAQNSSKKIHDCSDSNSLDVYINSNEFFAEDYVGINELCYISQQLGDVNLNFKIVDVFDGGISFEDRICDIKKSSYINTHVTLFKIGVHRSFLDILRKKDLDIKVLSRLEKLDSNPIWKYYLAINMLGNKENYKVIINLCKYVYENVNKFSYLDKEFFEKVGAHSLVILCDIYFSLNDYENFNKYIEVLDREFENCLDFIYFKVKFLEKMGNDEIDNFLNYIQKKLSKSNYYYSFIDDENKTVYECIGNILKKRGNFVLAASNFLRCNSFENINKIGQDIVDINNLIYKNNLYNSGVFFTSKPFCDIDFISDTSNKFNMFDIANTDYIRTFILELCAREIRDYNIQGEVGELGVFRGDFARFLNEIFSDRKLYLFDTFESFDNKDMKIEIENKFMNVDNLKSTHNFLKNVGTSVDIVMEKMKYKDNVIIKKGYFPESLNSLEEKFCFVSLDVDLYNPMLEGLKYFYERLSEGGYIFIHDYNHKVFGGIRAAVREFEKIIGKRVNKIPICDLAGSLIITK